MTAIREALKEVPGSLFVDLLEADDAYLLVIDLPGAVPEHTTVDVHDSHLRIEADRASNRPAEYSVVRADRPDRLEIEIPIPGDAFGSDASATIERGVMEIRLPKPPDAGETSIPIENA